MPVRSKQTHHPKQRRAASSEGSSVAWQDKAEEEEEVAFCHFFIWWLALGLHPSQPLYPYRHSLVCLPSFYMRRALCIIDIIVLSQRRQQHSTHEYTNFHSFWFICLLSCNYLWWHINLHSHNRRFVDCFLSSPYHTICLQTALACSYKCVPVSTFAVYEHPLSLASFSAICITLLALSLFLA